MQFGCKRWRISLGLWWQPLFFKLRARSFYIPLIGRSVGLSVKEMSKKVSKTVKRGFETTKDCTTLQQDYDSILECMIVHHQNKNKLFCPWKLQ